MWEIWSPDKGPTSSSGNLQTFAYKPEPATRVQRCVSQVLLLSEMDFMAIIALSVSETAHFN